MAVLSTANDGAGALSWRDVNMLSWARGMILLLYAHPRLDAVHASIDEFGKTEPPAIRL